MKLSLSFTLILSPTGVELAAYLTSDFTVYREKSFKILYLSSSPCGEKVISAAYPDVSSLQRKGQQVQVQLIV